MDATTILGGMVASLVTAITVLFAEMRKRPSKEEAESLRKRVRELEEQLEEANGQTQTLLRQWKDEVRERYRDARLFVAAQDARRRASSRPPGSGSEEPDPETPPPRTSSPGLYGMRTKKK